MGLFSRKKTETAVSEGVIEIVTTTAEDAAPEIMNEELIAVITAALSAYEVEQYRQTLYIRKTNRISGVRPVWGVTGTQEAIDTRRM